MFFMQALVGEKADKRVLDTRATISEKMGILEEALMNCKGVIDTAPSSWQVISSLVDDFSSAL